MTNFLQDRLVLNDPKYFLARQLLTSETDYQEICSMCHQTLPRIGQRNIQRMAPLGGGGSVSK